MDRVRFRSWLQRWAAPPDRFDAGAITWSVQNDALCLEADLNGPTGLLVVEHDSLVLLRSTLAMNDPNFALATSQPQSTARPTIEGSSEFALWLDLNDDRGREVAGVEVSLLGDFVIFRYGGLEIAVLDRGEFYTWLCAGSEGDRDRVVASEVLEVEQLQLAFGQGTLFVDPGVDQFYAMTPESLRALKELVGGG